MEREPCVHPATAPASSDRPPQQPDWLIIAQTGCAKSVHWGYGPPPVEDIPPSKAWTGCAERGLHHRSETLWHLGAW
jgi:hypothetical protein